MNPRTDRRARTGSARRITGISGIAVLWVTWLSADVHADSADDHWQISVPAYLTASASLQKKGEATVAYDSLIASVEVELTSQARPYSAGLFLDYVMSPDSRYDETVSVGGWLEYQFYKWDTTTYFAYDMAPGAPGAWLYGGRIRYKCTQRHKLGIEAFGSFEESASPKLMIAYYGTISRTVSVKFVAGLDTDADQQRVVRTEIVWQIK